MSLPLACLLYFAAGVVSDWLIARYYLCLSRRQAYWASGLATIITMFTVFVLANVIVDNDWRKILAYAIGTGFGCFLAVIRSR